MIGARHLEGRIYSPMLPDVTDKLRQVKKAAATVFENLKLPPALQMKQVIFDHSKPNDQFAQDQLFRSPMSSFLNDASGKPMYYRGHLPYRKRDVFFFAGNPPSAQPTSIYQDGITPEK